MKNDLYQYILMLGDNSMILGHRLSELCGHGPSLETDIALTNISLDLFGQVRNYFQYAAEISDTEKTEDDIAFLRYPHEYLNTLLVEQPNKDFAYVIARQFLYDTYHLLLMQQLMASNDKRISAIAAKSIKEVKYHFRFSSQWVKRLGDGTNESHQKMQEAITYLWPYAGELVVSTTIEKTALQEGIGADLESIKNKYITETSSVIKEASIEMPGETWIHSGGKSGKHTEHLGFILADLQYMQRTYPDMVW